VVRQCPRFGGVARRARDAPPRIKTPYFPKL